MTIAPQPNRAVLKRFPHSLKVPLSEPVEAYQAAILGRVDEPWQQFFPIQRRKIKAGMRGVSFDRENVVRAP